MGHDWYGHDQAYAPRCQAAYVRFDPAWLADLSITHWYVLPERLDPQQVKGLNALVGAGRATLVDSAGEGPPRREVYRLNDGQP